MPRHGPAAAAAAVGGVLRSAAGARGPRRADPRHRGQGLGRGRASAGVPFHARARPPQRPQRADPTGGGAGHDLWHVFYQLDPGFPAEPRRTGWGYATSEDLLTWRRRPQALFPDDVYDADGCFSGGAVAPQRPGDPVELFYTGNLPVPAEFAGHGSGSDPDAVPGAAPGTSAARLATAFPDGVPVGHVWGATQNLALAEQLPDGSLAAPVKHPANPLIPGPPPGFTAHYRDPIVTGDPDRPGLWRMLLGARTDDDRGAALLHFSRDRRTWDAGRDLLIDGPSPGGYMWECPNLLRMTDAAAEDAAADGADNADNADPEADPLVTVSLSGERVTVTRRTAGVPNHFGDERATTLRTRGSSTPGDGAGSGAAHHLCIVVDRSAIEIIADDGVALFSLRAFSADGVWTVRFT
ncbi:hypothetical protein [Corynebacterium xerosis]|uniref:hypothetical protein n=1 Tax=Corynebacterium xerosis TaxID=1725 RepID=UPI00366E88A3